MRITNIIISKYIKHYLPNVTDEELEIMSNEIKKTIDFTTKRISLLDSTIKYLIDFNYISEDDVDDYYKQCK